MTESSESKSGSGIDREGSTARTEAQAREFGPREVCASIGRKCRGHWHPGEWDDSYCDNEATADAKALRNWAEDESRDDVTLLESLAKDEEDRFNVSGTYIPNEVPGILRRIALDFVRYRALAATQERPAVARELAVDRSRSTPENASEVALASISPSTQEERNMSDKCICPRLTGARECFSIRYNTEVAYDGLDEECSCSCHEETRDEDDEFYAEQLFGSTQEEKK